ncbi:unnamed protein product, partial [Ectocarpus sp. 6 AP-2014]
MLACWLAAGWFSRTNGSSLKRTTKVHGKTGVKPIRDHATPARGERTRQGVCERGRGSENGRVRSGTYATTAGVRSPAGAAAGGEHDFKFTTQAR